MDQPDEYLSKREQQIMELVYELETVTANDLVERLPGRPSNSTVRTLLRILESKGKLKHEDKDGKFVYTATIAGQEAAKSALTGVVKTFFKGSLTDVMAALLGPDAQVSDTELEELAKLIQRAKEEGR